MATTAVVLLIWPTVAPRGSSRSPYRGAAPTAATQAENLVRPWNGRGEIRVERLIEAQHDASICNVARGDRAGSCVRWREDGGEGPQGGGREWGKRERGEGRSRERVGEVGGCAAEARGADGEGAVARDDPRDRVGECRADV